MFFTFPEDARWNASGRQFGVDQENGTAQGVEALYFFLPFLRFKRLLTHARGEPAGSDRCC